MATQAEKTDVYHLPHRFLYIEVLLVSLLSTLLLFAWIPALFSFFSYGIIFSSALRAGVFLNLTAVALLFLSAFIKREIKAISYMIDETYLVRRSSSKQMRIALAAITKVSLVKFPLGGGVLFIEGKGAMMLLPLMLVNCNILITKLEAACHNNSCCKDMHIWNEVHALCTLMDILQHQSIRYFRPILLLCILLLPINFITGAFFWDMRVIPLVLWTITGPLFPFIGYAISDGLIRFKIRRALLHGQGTILSKFAADSIIVRLGCFCFCFYLLLAIFYKMLVIR